MTYPRGSSLVEVLIAGSLALLVLGLGVGAWLFASRFMQRGTARAEL